MAYIVVLYKLGVGSTVPSGAISINFEIVTVFALTNSSTLSIGAPNFSKNAEGSIVATNLSREFVTDNFRSSAIATGPITPAVLYAVNNLP